MIIDITELITNTEDKIIIDTDVFFDKEKLEKTNIRKLINTKFKGQITKIYDEFIISGNLSGTMILPDDITLEDTEYTFKSIIEDKIKENEENIENNLKIYQNKLDITDFLWQNILVEIPMKIVNKKNENKIIKGDGWRLTTEEELKKENSNSPFKDLLEKFSNERSDK